MTTPAFTVEDGSAKTDANAYCTTAYVDQYNADHEQRASWLQANKQLCIRLATQYLEMRYRRRFRGQRWSETQALGYPRTDFEDDDGYSVTSGSSASMPARLTDACAELALNVADGDTLFASFSPEIESLSISNEAKSESVSYRGAAQASTTKVYPRVDMLLAPLLHSGSDIYTC
jgi:hypothetical protein